MPIGDTKDLIDYINQELSKPFERPEDDLGIAIGDPRPKGEFVHGLRVEEISAEPPTKIYDSDGLLSEVHYTTGRLPWRRKYYPRAPYRCVCGQVFPDAKALLEHTHPAGFWGPK